MTHLGILDRFLGRTDETEYQGQHRTERNEGPGYLLSPAATQLVTGTRDLLPAAADDATGLLRIRDIHPTGQFTTISKEGQR